MLVTKCLLFVYSEISFRNSKEKNDSLTTGYRKKRERVQRKAGQGKWKDLPRMVSLFCLKQIFKSEHPD